MVVLVSFTLSDFLVIALFLYIYVFFFTFSVKEAATDKDKEGTLHHSDEFECVICSQTSASTVDRPIAMVVLLQASSGKIL